MGTYACSRSMEASKQYHGTCRQAADHSNIAMEAQVVALVVAAIQQLLKLLYKSYIEAKQNNAHV